MQAHLLLRLEAPLMSFGTVAVDQNRPVQPWPAASMLTGLLGNALGWRRSDAAALDRLQARLRWAARIDRAGTAVNDFQTAWLGAGDLGWTTRGAVEGRTGGLDSYNSPHLRWRDYRADASVLVALRLEPPDEAPGLQDLIAALDRPARPLFLGRKGCPPAARLMVDLVDAAHAVAALDAGAPADEPPAPGTPARLAARVFFSDGAAPADLAPVHHRASDERRFALDVHAGWQTVHEIPARHEAAA